MRRIRRSITSLVAFATICQVSLGLPTALAAPNDTRPAISDISALLDGKKSGAFSLDKMGDDALTQLEQVATAISAEQVDAVLEAAPENQREHTRRVFEQLRSESGRKALLEEMRTVEQDPKMLEAINSERPAYSENSGESTVVGGTELPPAAPTPAPTRVTSGGFTPASPTRSVGKTTNTAPTACPVAQGTLPVPAGTPAGTALQPHTDSWLSGVTNPTVVQGDGNPTNGTDAQIAGGKLVVRVHLDSVKQYPVDAYDVVIRARRLGDTGPEQVIYPLPPGATPFFTAINRFCYVGSVTKGYWQGLLRLDPAWTEPGFQLTTEVVEYDGYFGCDPFQGPYYAAHCEISMQGWGAQFFAGGDRTTIHVGNNPVGRNDLAADGLGVFVTNAGEATTGPAAQHSLITDRDNNPANDAENLLRTLISRAAEISTENFNQSFIYQAMLNAFTDGHYQWTVGQGGNVSVSANPNNSTTFWSNVASALGVAGATLLHYVVELRADRWIMGVGIRQGTAAGTAFIDTGRLSTDAQQLAILGLAEELLTTDIPASFPRIPSIPEPVRGRQSTRDLILDTAESIIQCDGVDALSLQAIGDRGHLSPPSLYTHFESKGEILRALASRLEADCVSVGTKLFQATTRAGSPSEEFHLALSIVAAVIGAKGHALLSIDRVADAPPEALSHITRLRETVIQFLVAEHERIALAKDYHPTPVDREMWWFRSHLALAVIHRAGWSRASFLTMLEIDLGQLTALLATVLGNLFHRDCLGPQLPATIT
jgi:AcrR family transcriptional regulator